ncbi:LADA_0G06810g1_1 [Lachancea dasiensis]|uniref:LADA_0G06810g1_1 n=1 Tax=Lachancea dasiensis TaxID=1072105 RepID=A0A1G4JTC2_9SACH|nr:LADA_0G06810g1_1 [Lachancea dasiensis]
MFIAKACSSLYTLPVARRLRFHTPYDMRMGPRSIEELLYQKLMQSAGFHRFVRRVYLKVNGLEEPLSHSKIAYTAESVFKPKPHHKFKAFRVLFWDEMRSIFGLERRLKDRF